MTDRRIWTPLADAQTVAGVLSQRILAAATHTLSQRPRFRLVLAGGQTPALAYQALAQAPADWNRWEIYFGDERCLPANHTERNSVMAQVLTRHLPPTQVFPIPAELGANAGAAAYQATLTQALQGQPFDLVLLGLGEDGHTASLFPGHHHPAHEWVHPVFNAPKPPPERVSLSVQALNHSRQVIFAVTGASKQAAITAWRAGQDLPVQNIRAQETTEILLDLASITAD